MTGICMNTSDLITIDPEVLGGTPVFKGTRVPVKSLLNISSGIILWQISWNAFRPLPKRWLAMFWNGQRLPF